MQSSEKSAERTILALLKKKGPLTSVEIERELLDERKECPDALVLFLSRLKLEGKIKGELSVEKKGFVWSVG